MGVTYDVVPILDGEDPDNAVFRVWGGDPRLDDPPPPRPVSAESSAKFRQAAIERIAACAPWERHDDERTVTFWRPGCEWQVEVNAEDITLRHRSGPVGAEDEGADPTPLLVDIFRELDCMVVFDNADGWVRLRDEPDFLLI